MARNPILVANWKMYKTVEEARAYGRELVRLWEGPRRDIPARDLVICPPFLSVWALSQRLSGSIFQVGGQDLALGQEGALTGAVSGYLLRDAGAQYVILGHSERRQHFGETDAVVAAKLKASYDWRLTPIVCIGESAEDYMEGRTEAVLRRQVEALLGAIPSEGFAQVIIAYEPIWAIGTGHVPLPDAVNDIGQHIRQWVRDALGDPAEHMRILYGGSVSTKNIVDFWRQPEIDGALVGGASLHVREFVNMALMHLGD